MPLADHRPPHHASIRTVLRVSTFPSIVVPILVLALGSVTAHAETLGNGAVGEVRESFSGQAYSPVSAPVPPVEAPAPQEVIDESGPESAADGESDLGTEFDLDTESDLGPASGAPAVAEMDSGAESDPGDELGSEESEEDADVDVGFGPESFPAAASVSDDEGSESLSSVAVEQGEPLEDVETNLAEGNDSGEGELALSVHESAGELSEDAEFEEEEAQDEEPEPRRSFDVDGFIKGELTTLGTTKLIMQDTRFGLRGGVSKIHDTLYLLTSLELDLRFGKFGLGLAAPAQFRLMDPNKGFFEGGFLPDGVGGGFRLEDYDEVSEIMRLVRYLTYGGKEQNFYLNLSTDSAGTIGHGAVVRRYIANIDVDRGRLSGQFDAYGRFGGIESFVGDVLRPDRLFGVLGFVKPFGNSSNLMLQSLSFGLTYTADLSAPYELERDDNGRPILGGDAPTSPKVAQSAAAQIMGISVETKVAKSKNIDIKPWLDVSTLVVDGKSLGAATNGGTGLTLGLLGRFNFFEHKHAVRAIVEGRMFEGNYLPGYFDSVYEVQRYQYLTGRSDYTLRPKLNELLNRQSDLQLGYYLELQYAWVHRFAVTAAWEDSSAVGGRNLVLHAEVPTFKYLKLFATAHRRSVEGGLFDVLRQTTGQLDADNTLFFAGARLRILPFLFLNARVYRAWRMDPTDTYRTFRNVEGFEIDLEGGFEFNRKRE